MVNGDKVFNILSIDWDYFIKASDTERGELFPDGGTENIPSSIRDIIWGSRYADDRLGNIDVIDEYYEFCNTLCSILHRDNPEVCIYESHRHIYDHIKSMCNGRINLVNIDFHHDMFNDSDEVNCGNWLSHIVREYDGRFTWVAREDSFQIDKKLSKKVKIITNPLDLDSLSEIRWDLIYICRSDMWSPPHLDKKFSKMVDIVDECSCNVTYEESIFCDRYSEIEGMVKGLKSVIRKRA